MNWFKRGGFTSMPRKDELAGMVHPAEAWVLVEGEWVYSEELSKTLNCGKP